MGGFCSEWYSCIEHTLYMGGMQCVHYLDCHNTVSEWPCMHRLLDALIYTTYMHEYLHWRIGLGIKGITAHDTSCLQHACNKWMGWSITTAHTTLWSTRDKDMHLITQYTTCHLMEEYVSIALITSGDIELQIWHV